jgi:hypothetical protein
MVSTRPPLADSGPLVSSHCQEAARSRQGQGFPPGLSRVVHEVDALGRARLGTTFGEADQVFRHLRLAFLATRIVEDLASLAHIRQEVVTDAEQDRGFLLAQAAVLAL